MTNEAVQVEITTNHGTIRIELNAAKAPVSVENFIKYVESGHFDGTIFHRVINGFMIQGGGMTPDMNQKTTQAPIKLEAGLSNLRGTIAMARTNNPNSATNQFFINLVDNHFLNASPGNPGYAVFGQVTEGMEVVDDIAKVKTGRHGPHSDVPVEPVLIESVRINQK